MDVWPFILFAPAVAFATYLCIRAMKFGGFRGAFYGARVARTLGYIELPRRATIRMTVKVHILEASDADAPSVGLELQTSSLTGRGFVPVAFTAEQARELANMLMAAADDRHGRM